MGKELGRWTQTLNRTCTMEAPTEDILRWWDARKPCCQLHFHSRKAVTPGGGPATGNSWQDQLPEEKASRTGWVRSGAIARDLTYMRHPFLR